MRPLPLLCALLLTAATPAFAQVTVDLHALQALPDRPAASHTPRPTPAVGMPNRTTIVTREAPAPGPAAPFTATGAATNLAREHSEYGNPRADRATGSVARRLTAAATGL